MNLTLIRAGTFSGGALSLRAALAEHARVTDIDLQRFSRSKTLIPRRLLAHVEGQREGCPWMKTEAWSKATQRHVERLGLLRSPILFVQSIHAYELPPDTRYATYTDRVGLEGARAEYPSLFSEGWHRRERVFLQNADRIFLAGPSTKSVLVDEYRVDADKILVVGSGPNLPPSPLRVSKECKHLVFVGKEWERKGGPELLRAFSAVRQRHPQLRLSIIGSNPDIDLPGVSIKGSVPPDQMPDVYKGADLLVIPTRAEPFGFALVEALTLGIPCVGTTVGNQEWIIGEGGMCVLPSDETSLMEALDEVIENYPIYKKRAESRAEDMRNTFSWAVIGRKVLEWAQQPG